MPDNYFPILTPVGRLVSGSIFEARDKDFQGNAYKGKDGQPISIYNFGIAIAKDDPGLAAFFDVMKQAGAQGHPRLFQGGAMPDDDKFSWKWTDGDSTKPNAKGNKPCDREGFPGHHVFFFSGQHVPKVYSRGGESVIADKSAVKRGYYIRVSGNIKANESESNPGIYLNYGMIEFYGHGEEIQTGPDAKSVFGDAPSNVPKGVTSAPVASGPGLSEAMPTPPPSDGISQSTGFMDVAPPPPADEPEKFLYQDKQYTREQLKAANWTDAAIDKLPKWVRDL